MSEGNSDKGQFVNIENYLSRNENQSWADETEEDHERESNKPRAWGTVPSTFDEAPNLLQIQAEEQKAAAEASSKAAAEAAKRPYRAPHNSNQGNSERYHERPQREKQPIPTEPPYTAFIGNLAFDVTEEDLMDYFGELEVVNIRLLKDQSSGKPKGFGYIEFQTAEGLSKALLANEGQLKGRAMNMDVAKPQQANSWGSGNRERNSRPNKQDTTWGPSAGGSFKDRMTTNRPPPQSSKEERPKLNIHPPPSKPLSPREPPKNVNKPSAESIFGTKMGEEELKKMNKISEERVKKELEKEAIRKEQVRNREKTETDNRLSNPRKEGRGDNQQDRFTSSWRGSGTGKGQTTVKQPYNTNFSRQQEDHSRPSGKGPQKPQVDSDGFRGQTSRPASHNRGWETQGNSRSETQRNAGAKEIQNKFDILVGDE